MKKLPLILIVVYYGLVKISEQVNPLGRMPVPDFNNDNPRIENWEWM